LTHSTWKKDNLGYSYRERSVGERKDLREKWSLLLKIRYLQELLEYKTMKDQEIQSSAKIAYIEKCLDMISNS
jgi:hypothetical protein